jgi:colanic acid biosynthesis protein WcaH
MSNSKNFMNDCSGLNTKIKQIKETLTDPKEGLPQELFYFVSELTPMINVDLLIKDPQKGTLLTWREDNFYGPGWHIPGGIIRFKENIETRIRQVAKTELGLNNIEFHQKPILVSERMNHNRNVRGHFISLLYLCHIFEEPPKKLQYLDNQKNSGDWLWHSKCPENLLNVQDQYKVFINQTSEEIQCTTS